EVVVDITLEPSISTNPYLQFEAKVTESGTFNFTWYDDDGSVYEESSEISVS
ncbi:MAG: thiosulfate oxidation carrier complex protein SoxZ, partial [Paracoccaceae bacterium]